MINLSGMKTGYLKFTHTTRGTKTYRAIYDGIGGFAKISRKDHKTAKQAFNYGVQVCLRLHRLQDAALLSERIEKVSQ